MAVAVTVLAVSFEGTEGQDPRAGTGTGSESIREQSISSLEPVYGALMYRYRQEVEVCRCASCRNCRVKEERREGQEDGDDDERGTKCAAWGAGHA